MVVRERPQWKGRNGVVQTYPASVIGVKIRSESRQNDLMLRADTAQCFILERAVTR